jgi:hypothetical protein
MPTQNLTIYDILAHEIPGVTLLLFVLPASTFVWQQSGSAQLFPTYDLGSGLLSVIFLISSYLIGVIIQGVAGRPTIRFGKYDVNQLTHWYDQRVINLDIYSSEELDKPFNAQLRRRYERTDGKLIIDRSEEIFGLSFTQEHGDKKVLDERMLGTLYWLVQSYLFNQDVMRSQRWSILEKFFRGVWLSLVLSILINSGLMILLLYFEVPVLLLFVVGGIIVLALGSSFIAHLERRKYGRYWGGALIDDFYTWFVVYKI